jgi:hypothetical protein
MAQLTAGNYLTRNNRIVTLVSSSVNSAGQTVWAANLLGPIGGSDPLGTDSPVTYIETGVALPNGNTQPISPLATQSVPSNLLPTVPPGSNIRETDLLCQVGASQTTLGARG